MSAPVRVGLVGAGPWARMAHAPVLTGGPETELVGVWARRPEAATELATEFGTEPVTDFGALLDSCEAVAFAVPPAVQGSMAVQAAEAGKHLLLDKPVAGSLADAERLAAAVRANGVQSMVFLTLRFNSAVRRFLAVAADADPVGASIENLSGGFLAGPFSQSPWRQEGGILPDGGPHVVDVLTAILGPAIAANADARRDVVRLSLRHEGGAFSHAVLSAHHTGPPVQRLRVYSPSAVLDCDWKVEDPDLWGTIRREFAECVRSGVAHPLDVHRGVELQRVLALASS